MKKITKSNLNSIHGGWKKCTGYVGSYGFKTVCYSGGSDGSCVGVYTFGGDTIALHCN